MLLSVAWLPLHAQVAGSSIGSCSGSPARLPPATGQMRQPSLSGDSLSRPRAGTPTAIAYSGMSCVTTARHPMTAPVPIDTPAADDKRPCRSIRHDLSPRGLLVVVVITLFGRGWNGWVLTNGGWSSSCFSWPRTTLLQLSKSTNSANAAKLAPLRI